MQWLFHWLALQHGRCLQLECAVFFRLDIAQGINRLPQRVNYTTEEIIPDRNGENLTGPLNFVAFLQDLEVAQDHNTDGIGVEVLGNADDAIRELQQLVRHHGR